MRMCPGKECTQAGTLFTFLKGLLSCKPSAMFSFKVLFYYYFFALNSFISLVLLSWHATV